MLGREAEIELQDGRWKRGTSTRNDEQVIGMRNCKWQMKMRAMIRYDKHIYHTSYNIYNQVMIALQAKGLHLEDFQHLAGSSTEQRIYSNWATLASHGFRFLDSDSGQQMLHVWHHKRQCCDKMCFRSLPATTWCLHLRCWCRDSLRQKSEELLDGPGPP